MLSAMPNKYIRVHAANVEAAIFLDKIVSIAAHPESQRIIVEMCNGKNLIIPVETYEDVMTKYMELMEIIDNTLK